MIKPPRLTKKQHELLAPFADKYREVVLVDLDKKPASGIRALRKAALACSQTNCGWDEYGGAQIILTAVGRGPAMRGRS